MRYNPELQTSCVYYRLVESYRLAEGRVCHRTILNVGFINLAPEVLNKIQKHLTNRAEAKSVIFEEKDLLVKEYVEKYWNEIVSKKRIDLPEEKLENQKKLVDLESVKTKNVREIGSE